MNLSGPINALVRRDARLADGCHLATPLFAGRRVRLELKRDRRQGRVQRMRAPFVAANRSFTLLAGGGCQTNSGLGSVQRAARHWNGVAPGLRGQRALAITIPRRLADSRNPLQPTTLSSCRQSGIAIVVNHCAQFNLATQKGIINSVRRTRPSSAPARCPCAE